MKGQADSRLQMTDDDIMLQKYIFHINKLSFFIGCIMSVILDSKTNHGDVPVLILLVYLADIPVGSGVFHTNTISLQIF